MSRQRWQFALAGLLCTIAVTPISATQLSVGQRGQASWYGEFHEGKLMANQHAFRMDEATVAHRTLPLGTAYAVWTGVGAAGTVVLGIALFGEPAGAARLVCVGLILAGIVGLQVLSPA